MTHYSLDPSLLLTSQINCNQLDPSINWILSSSCPWLDIPVTGGIKDKPWKLKRKRFIFWLFLRFSSLCRPIFISNWLLWFQLVKSVFFLTGTPHQGVLNDSLYSNYVFWVLCGHFHTSKCKTSFLIRDPCLLGHRSWLLRNLKSSLCLCQSIMNIDIQFDITPILKVIW